MSRIGFGNIFSSALGIVVRQGRLGMLLVIASSLCGCSPEKTAPPPMPPPAVAVIKVAIAPVTVYEDYAAQTEAVETIEIRARVGGILERQAFKDGARIKKGDLLFVIDQQPYMTALTQAKANLGQAEAAYLNSKQILARLRPLGAAGVVSKQDLDTAIARERADAAAVEAGKAQVLQAQMNLDYTTIRAPRDGLISRAMIKPGGLVNASTTLLTTMYSVDPIYVGFTVSEQKLEELQRQYLNKTATSAPGIRIKLVDGSDYRYAGTLDFVDAAVDPRNGTLPVRLILPNPDGVLRSGQFVRAIVPARHNPNTIMIPQKAVQELQGKRSIFVVGPDNKASYRDIVVNTRLGNNWIVEQGVKPGELVIVDGISKVKPGTPVKPVLVAQEQAGNAAVQPAK